MATLLVSIDMLWPQKYAFCLILLKVTMDPIFWTSAYCHIFLSSSVITKCIVNIQTVCIQTLQYKEQIQTVKQLHMRILFLAVIDRWMVIVTQGGTLAAIKCNRLSISLIRTCLFTLWTSSTKGEKRVFFHLKSCFLKEMTFLFVIWIIFNCFLVCFQKKNISKNVHKFS